MSKKTVPHQPDDHEVEREVSEQELIETPKGQSRVKFLLLLGLTILILLIFTVGDQIMTTAQRRGSSGAYMTWNRPGQGLEEITYNDFITVKRQLDDFYSVQGIRNNRNLVSDRAVAELMVIDALAYDAGIDVSKKELERCILQGQWPFIFRGYMNGEIYLQSMKNAGVAPADFEAILHRLLRQARYEIFMRGVFGVPSPEAIELAWKEDHPEFAFEYVEVESASFEAAALAELPDDAALTQFYADFPRRDVVWAADMELARASAEVFGWRATGEDAASGLLAKFPRPEGADAEAEAKAYYDLFYDRRFKRPNPPDESAEPDARKRNFLTFEEAADACRKEAPVHRALGDFLADATRRIAAGETVDLALQASELGLYYFTDNEQRSQEDWRALGGLVGPFLADALFRTDLKTNFTAAVVIDEGGLAVGRVKEKRIRQLPPFAAMRDKVIVEWQKRRSGELALDQLRAIQAALPKPEPSEGQLGPTTVDAAAFAAACEAAGLPVQRREWQQQEPPAVGPQPVASSPAAEYLRSAAMLYRLADGEVSDPALHRDGARAYLVRAAGKRDPEVVRVKPREYEDLKSRTGNEAYMEWRKRNLSASALGTRFDLRLLTNDGLMPLPPEEEEPQS